MKTSTSIFIFILMILVAWAYIHVGFLLIGSVEERQWGNMEFFDKIIMISGMTLVLSSVFIIFTFDNLMKWGKK